MTEVLLAEISILKEKNNQLEQRYEQLEHVAKEMLKEIIACENNIDGWWHHVEHFRERLRDLEVSLDD